MQQPTAPTDHHQSSATSSPPLQCVLLTYQGFNSTLYQQRDTPNLIYGLQIEVAGQRRQTWSVRVKDGAGFGLGLMKLKDSEDGNGTHPERRQLLIYSRPKIRLAIMALSELSLSRRRLLVSPPKNLMSQSAPLLLISFMGLGPFLSNKRARLR